MLEDAVRWCCEQINDNYNTAADIDHYVVYLGGDALELAEVAWTVSAILASVVFSIIACYELYAQSVRTQGNGGPMGNAEVIFKVMFKVAVCFVLLQVSFNILYNLYETCNDLIMAFYNEFGFDENGATAEYATITEDNVELIISSMDSFASDLGLFLFALIVALLSWVARIFATILVMMRVLQVYLYLAISPIPLATFPSQEYSQIGKSFLKSFIAVGFQGVLIYLVVRFAPVVINTVLDGYVMPAEGGAGMFLAAILYSVAIIVMLAGTQQMSKRICGAM